MAWVFYILSVAGFLLSVAAHVSTFLGYAPQDIFPYIWALHAGIFVVILPAVVFQTRFPRKKRQFLYPYAPKLLKRLNIALGVYAICNFIIFLFLMRHGGPEIRGGQFVLADHGKVYRTITAAEYGQYKCYLIRGFSGHWMLFYSMGMAIYASAIRQTRILRDAAERV